MVRYLALVGGDGEVGDEIGDTRVLVGTLEVIDAEVNQQAAPLGVFVLTDSVREVEADVVDGCPILVPERAC